VQVQAVGVCRHVGIVALGLVNKEQIDEVLTDAPQAPTMAQTTGIDPVFLVELMIKGRVRKILRPRSVWSIR
jgi:hypothetical protein